MNFYEYQEFTDTTAIYKESIKKYVDSLEIPDEKKAADLTKFLSLAYAVLGLTNEAGEVAGKLKKIIRDQNCKVSTEAMNNLADEVGDVFWYQAQTLNNLNNLNGDTILKLNINKLKDRQERNVLGGSGDKR
jgi:NTP pyrophosphatase (non-canonical NTP hydrolase)